MKQSLDVIARKETFEEAAMRELNSSYAIAVDGELAYQRAAMLNMFRKGAQWQARQSPWVSVEERLPDTNNGQSLYEVLVKTGDGRYNVACNVNVESLAERGEVTHWMPIPEFSEN